MQLEDHVGDIIRKACAMNSISPAAAAATAGVAAPDLADFYETGRGGEKIHLAALAQMAGLDKNKIEILVSGWRPTPKDLQTWRNLRMVSTTGEGLTVNCYLIWDTATREAALFDTGLDAQPVLATLAAEGLSLRHIFITHSHWDHVEAMGPLRQALPAVQLHVGSKKDPLDQQNRADEIIALGGLSITHRETPGHSPDGVTYLISGWQPAAPLVAVVGDTIFAGSMGNGNGAWKLAQQKVREEILTLPGDTLICPGHGPLTTVAEELAHNPFF